MRSYGTSRRLNPWYCGSARGESRTRTGLPPADFESENPGSSPHSYSQTSRANVHHRAILLGRARVISSPVFGHGCRWNVDSSFTSRRYALHRTLLSHVLLLPLIPAASGRTRFGAVGAEHAAIALLGPCDSAAGRAVPEEQAGVSRHVLHAISAAGGTANHNGRKYTAGSGGIGGATRLAGHRAGSFQKALPAGRAPGPEISIHHLSESHLRLRPGGLLAPA